MVASDAAWAPTGVYCPARGVVVWSHSHPCRPPLWSSEPGGPQAIVYNHWPIPMWREIQRREKNHPMIPYGKKEYK